MAVLGLVFLVGTVALPMYNLYNNAQQDLKIDTLWEKAAEFEKQNEAFRKSLESLASNQKKIVDRILQLEHSLEKFKSDLTYTNLYTSELIMKFVYYRVLLNNARDDVKKKRLPEQFLELFNFTLQCADCPIEHTRNFHCATGNKGSRLVLKFDAHVIDPNITVSYADAFELRERNETHTCLKQYSGDKYVILMNNTMCPIEPRYFEKEDMMLTPEIMDCQQNVSNTWTTSNCVENEKFRGTSQIKNIRDEFYIYCSGENITYLNKTRQCPDFPFRISNDMTFEISGKKFKSEIAEKTIDIRETAKINFLIDSNPLEFTLKEVIIPKPTAKMNFVQQLTSKAFWSLTTILIVCFASLTCLCSTACCAYWIINRQSQNSIMMVRPLSTQQITNLALKRAKSDTIYRVDHLY